MADEPTEPEPIASDPPDESTPSPAIRPNRKRLAILIGLGLLAVGIAVYLWTRSPIGLERTLVTPAEAVTALHWDQTHQRLYIGSRSGAVYVWDRSGDGDRVRGDRQQLASVLDRPITAITMTTDGMLFATTDAGEMAGWQIDPKTGTGTGETARPDGVLPAAVTAIDLHPNRFEVAFGLADGTVAVLSGAGHRMLGVKNPDRITAVRYLPGGDRLLTGTERGKLRVWTVRDGRSKPVTDSPHDAAVSVLTIAPEGDRLLSGDWNGHLALWEIRAGNLGGKTAGLTPLRSIATGHQLDAVSGAMFTEESILTTDWAGTVWEWSRLNLTRQNELPTETPMSRSLPLTGTDRFASFGPGGEVRVWEVGKFVDR